MRDHPASARLAVALYLHRLRWTARMSQYESRWDVSQSLNIRPRDRWRLTLSVGVMPWLYPRAVCRCHCKQQSAWPIRICKDMHQKRSTISCTWIWVTTALDKMRQWHRIHSATLYNFTWASAFRATVNPWPLICTVSDLRPRMTWDALVSPFLQTYKLMSAANSFEHPLNYYYTYTMFLVENCFLLSCMRMCCGQLTQTGRLRAIVLGRRRCLCFCSSSSSCRKWSKFQDVTRFESYQTDSLAPKCSRKWSIDIISTYEQQTKPTTSAKGRGWNGHRFSCVPHRS